MQINVEDIQLPIPYKNVYDDGKMILTSIMILCIFCFWELHIANMFKHCLLIYLHYVLSIPIETYSESTYYNHEFLIDSNLHIFFISPPQKCKYMVPTESIWNGILLEDEKVIFWHIGFCALQKLWGSDSTLQNLPNFLAFLQQWMQIAARLRDRRSGRCTQGHSLGYFGGFALQYQASDQNMCLSKTCI